MLCQFIFKNFKSFKDEAILDMQAVNITEHEDSLIVDETDGEIFLPLAVIYGPNGGGKSNVLNALMFLEQIILTPIMTLKESQNDMDESFLGRMSLKKISFDKLSNSHSRKTDLYYKFDNFSHKKPIEFDISFRFKKKEFKYQLRIVKGKIWEENFFYKDLITNNFTVVFERDKEGIYLDEILENTDINNIKPSIPLLSYISITKNIEVIDDAIEWFFRNFTLNYDHPFRDREVFISENKKDKKILFGMLNEMDINIKDIRIVRDTEGQISDIYLKHQLSSDNEGELLLEEQSSGTRKLFGMLPFIIESLRAGNLVVADEIDAKLHPKLLRYIIELFTNPDINKKGAQLLFTSHDLTTMKNTIFRRDEIWFAALDENNASKLFSLVEFRKDRGEKVRKDETYDKQYIEGRYGADPYLRKILDWGKIK